MVSKACWRAELRRGRGRVRRTSGDERVGHFADLPIGGGDLGRGFDCHRNDVEISRADCEQRQGSELASFETKLDARAELRRIDLCVRDFPVFGSEGMTMPVAALISASS